MDAEVSNPEGSSDDENLENQYDDSFEENNKDLIEQEESQEDEENQKIYAWGSHKEQFYQSDEQSDSELEDEEEKEALEIQKRNAEVLEENDFFDEEIGNEDFLHKELKQSNEKERIDINALTEEEKLNLIVEESPELLSLLKDYKKCIIDLKNKMEPLKQILLSNDYEISNKLKSFICLKNDIVGSYCTYILYYISLKNTKNFSKSHPVFNKMINAKSMLNKLKPFEKMFSQEINTLIDQFQSKKIDMIKKNIKDKKSLKKEKSAKKSSSILKNNKAQNQKSKNSNKDNLKAIYNEIDDPEEDKRIGISKSKKISDSPKNDILQDLEIFSEEEDYDIDSSDFEDEFYKGVKKQKKIKNQLQKINKKIEKEQFFSEIHLAQIEENEGRKITYEMLKNKGLTRKRKKIDRNSRVKLRSKFKKSINKLKSKGIFLRKKEDVYKGELAGINAGLIKSVPLKSK